MFKSSEVVMKEIGLQVVFNTYTYIEKVPYDILEERWIYVEKETRRLYV